ncbi:tetratricopeptide repeat protein [Ferrimonas futtsuensis]|uniref:tetratricopeptide repeat protein n=1 Tax=Ferrimonas futtsuensis TaxID=364764 RepID=UPI000A04604A|nr:tetratricopeptide repeat protein [Ferrimonas futtsuensis]
MIRKLLPILMLLSACASTEAPAPSAELQLTSAGNYAGLADHLRGQLENRPDDTTLLLKLAHAYYRNDDLESARFYLGHLETLGHQSPQQSLLAGKAAADQGEFAAALEHYTKAQQQGLTSSELALRQGVARAQLGQYDAAKAAFNRARLRGHDELAVKNNLAMLQLAQGHYQQAIAMLEPLYRRHPDNPQIQANLALAWAKGGDLNRAHRLLATLYPDQPLGPVLQQLQRLSP